MNPSKKLLAAIYYYKKCKSETEAIEPSFFFNFFKEFWARWKFHRAGQRVILILTDEEKHILNGLFLESFNCGKLKPSMDDILEMCVNKFAP